MAVAFVLVFVIGFGSGRFAGKGDNVKYPVPSNYTTSANKTKVESPIPANIETIEEKEVLGQSTTTPIPAVTADCPVKGNISSSGRNLYHVKGGAFYERVKAERCFNTKSEAEAAGFVASSR